MDTNRTLLSPWRRLSLLVLACTLSACVNLGEQRGEPRPAVQPPGETAQARELPATVAIMPFTNQTKEPGAAERLRKNFYNTFSAKPYVDIELAVIDDKIARLEWETGRTVADLGPGELCRAIGCEALIFGTVTNYSKSFAGIYSRLGEAAEVWMVDTRNGEELLRVRDAVNYYEGNIPLTPLGALMTTLSAAANVRELQEVRMVNELAHKLVGRIPDPVGVPAIRRPEIKEVITNAGEGQFGTGEIVRVGLDGEPGIVASFDIGNFKRGLPMKESQPGVYLGEYAILPGDNTRGMPIITHLKRPSGPESQWIDTSGLVTIDTLPPPAVEKTRVSGYYDRIELSWEYPSTVADLAGFLVLRSRHPLSGYEQLAQVELKLYEDRQVTPDSTYYYRVVAVDQAGNRADAVDTVEARLAMKGPMVLTGAVQGHDTRLAGMYTLRGDLDVPSGVTLAIAAGTTIMAEKGSVIRVAGTLLIDGLAGQVRLFSRQGEEWAGVRATGGRVEMKGVLLSGAAIGVELRDTAGVIENAMFSDNGVGLAITGDTPVTVRNCWLAGNRTGIEANGAGAKVLQSAIVRNGTGLSLRNFGGEVRENIIIDNGRNILSDFPLKLDPNYLGQRSPNDGARYSWQR